MTDPEQTAREILANLQDFMVDKDLDRLGQLMDDDVVLFGTSSASLTREQTMAYVGDIVAQDGTIVWEWDTVVPLVSEPGLLCFAVLGTVGLAGSDRDPFRLTCVAVQDRGHWRLRHFHGSVPEHA